MKRLLLLIVLVYATVVVTVVLLSATLINKDMSKQPLIAGNSQPILLEDKIYYVPVVPMDSLKMDISMSYLENNEVVSDEINKGKLPKVLNHITYVKSSQILSYLKNNYIGVILPTQIQDGIKTLSLDGQYYFETMPKKENYKLVYVRNP